MIFLSFTIAALALVFLSGIGLVFLGFNRAGAASDLALNGFQYQWGAVGLWLLLSITGAGLSSGVVTYWLSR